MQSKSYWKLFVALAPIVFCACLLSPWELGHWPWAKGFGQWRGNPLKLGPDLAGGTTLIYEVDVPQGVSAKQAVEDTIAILRARVDPTGVKNLNWRRSGENRIEIQIAQPSADVQTLREAYNTARKKLLATDVAKTRRELDAAAGLGDTKQREAEIARLAGDSKPRIALFTQVVDTQQKLTAVQAAYEKAKLEYFKAKAAVNALTPTTAPATTAPSAEETALKAELAKAEGDLIEKAQAYNKAKTAGDLAQQGLRGLGVSADDLDRIVNAPDVPGATMPSARQRAINDLVKLNPDQEKDINQFASAYHDFEKVKGDLDDPEDLISLLHGSGVLEFRIGTPPPNTADYIQRLQSQGPSAGQDLDYRWFVIDNEDSFLGSEGTEKARQELHANPAGYLMNKYGLAGQEYQGKYYILLANTTDASLTRKQADSGWKLVKAKQEPDREGFPAVGLELNTVGGSLMRGMSTTHVSQQLAIVLDDRVVSTANIRESLGAVFEISRGGGGFSEKEMSYMVRTMNAGSLSYRVSDRPIAIQKTGPQFGQDNLRAGLHAVIWSFVIVSLFMLAYYFFWGGIAVFALVANLVIVLGLMSGLEATFTLPGIAGLVLTIGMAVDANVLIFERIREELERNNPLKTAIRLGYAKALPTIIDANFTTLLTCLILGFVATADIKGFAITLGIGLVANVFTAVFCSHAITNLVVDWINPTSLPMLPIKVPAIRRAFHPQFDWYGHRHWFWWISATLSVAGLIAIAVRGIDFLDIEFRSGTQVAFELGHDAAGKQRWMDTEAVRQRLTDYAKAHPDLADLGGDRATVVTVGETRREGNQILGSQFSIATLVTDSPKVSDAIKKVFEDVLDVTLPLAFAGDGGKEVATPAVTAGPVFPITRTRLEEVLGRADAPATHTLEREYVGGAAILLDNLTPPVTLDDLKGRIERMTFQPRYNNLSARRFAVIGLDAAPQAPGDPALRYRSAAVVCHEDRLDAANNYLTNPDPAYFAEPGGLASTEWNLVRDALHRDTSLGSVTNFSEQVSATMTQQAFLAILLSCAGILLYIWFRFGSVRYGSGAVIAMIHDVVVAVGLAALAKFLCEGPLQGLGHALLLQPFRVNLALIASVLTLIGYSVNDTIVVFDRIRENRGKLALATRQIINDSINQTLSRTILTAFTVFLSVAILYTVGGEGIRGFAFIMLIGTIVGCYSSIAVASPILLMPVWAFKINGGVTLIAGGAGTAWYVVARQAEFAANGILGTIGMVTLLLLAAGLAAVGLWLIFNGTKGWMNSRPGMTPPAGGGPNQQSRPAASPPRSPSAPEPTAK